MRECLSVNALLKHRVCYALKFTCHSRARVLGAARPQIQAPNLVAAQYSALS